MNQKTLKKVRVLTTSFISAVVAIAITTGKTYLAIIGILIGTLFLLLVTHGSKAIIVDERVEAISGQAARLTYVIITILLGVLALLFIFAGRWSGEIYLESLGTIFCYIVCLSMAIYSVSYKYLDKKSGGDN